MRKTLLQIFTYPLSRRFSGFPRSGYVSSVPWQGTKVRGIEMINKITTANKSQGYGHWWVWFIENPLLLEDHLKNHRSWFGCELWTHATNYISTSVFLANTRLPNNPKKQILRIGQNSRHPVPKLVGGWTTHLKNMLVKLGSSFPNGSENKKFLKPPPKDCWWFRNPKLITCIKSCR